MTWDQIVSIEPRLKLLASRASRESISANKDELWSTRYKPALMELTGFYGHNAALRNSEAYEIAVKKICELLRY